MEENIYVNQQQEEWEDSLPQQDSAILQPNPPPLRLVFALAEPRNLRPSVTKPTPDTKIGRVKHFKDIRSKKKKIL